MLNVRLIFRDSEMLVEASKVAYYDEGVYVWSDNPLLAKYPEVNTATGDGLSRELSRRDGLIGFDVK